MFEDLEKSYHHCFVIKVYYELAVYHQFQGLHGNHNIFSRMGIWVGEYGTNLGEDFTKFFALLFITFDLNEAVLYLLDKCTDFKYSLDFVKVFSLRGLVDLKVVISLLLE